jgi:hypothetical protein
MSWLKIFWKAAADMQFDHDHEWWAVFANLACKLRASFVTEQPGTRIFSTLICLEGVD